MAHEARYRNKTPPKWQIIWNQLVSGKYFMVLTEPHISEIYNVLEILGGAIGAECYLRLLKGMSNVKVVPSGDGDKMAFTAGQLVRKHRNHNISIVDAYIIAAAVMNKAMIYTADEGLMKAAKKERCEVNFIPGEELKKYMSL
jgi:predicted nucleic acid-binding protein